MKRVLAIAALAVVAAAPATQAAGRIPLNIWVGHKSWIPYVEDFNKVQDTYQASYTINGSTDALIAAVAAGDPPDVFRADSNGTLSLAAVGAIEPLDAFIERDNVDLSKFIPGVMQQVQWAGHTWALPVNADGFMFYYNKDLMSSSGLDPNSPPQTWGELEADARKITKIDANNQIEQLGYPWSEARDLQLNMFQEGIMPLTSDLKSVGYDTPAMVALLTRYVNDQDQINGGNAAVTAFQKAVVNGSGFNDLFVSGKEGFYLDHQALEFNLESNAPNLHWGLANPPLPVGGKRVDVSGAHRVMIPKGAKNVQGAWAFIKWVSSKQAGLAFAMPGFSKQFISEDYQGIGQSLSARIDVDQEAPFFRTPLWAPYADEAQYAVAFPRSPNSNTAWNALGNQLADVLNHKITPAAAVASATKTANAEIAQALVKQQAVLDQLQ